MVWILTDFIMPNHWTQLRLIRKLWQWLQASVIKRIKILLSRLSLIWTRTSTNYGSWVTVKEDLYKKIL